MHYNLSLCNIRQTNSCILKSIHIAGNIINVSEESLHNLSIITTYFAPLVAGLITVLGFSFKYEKPVKNITRRGRTSTIMKKTSFFYVSLILTIISTILIIAGIFVNQELDDIKREKEQGEMNLRDKRDSIAQAGIDSVRARTDSIYLVAGDMMSRLDKSLVSLGRIDEHATAILHPLKALTLTIKETVIIPKFGYQAQIYRKSKYTADSLRSINPDIYSGMREVIRVVPRNGKGYLEMSKLDSTILDVFFAPIVLSFVKQDYTKEKIKQIEKGIYLSYWPRVENFEIFSYGFDENDTANILHITYTAKTFFKNYTGLNSLHFMPSGSMLVWYRSAPWGIDNYPMLHNNRFGKCILEENGISYTVDMVKSHIYPIYSSINKSKTSSGQDIIIGAAYMYKIKDVFKL